MNLTEHLLSCLAEECAEVGKECSKAMRFGLDDHYEKVVNGETVVHIPRDKLIVELNDLMGAIEVLAEHGIIPPTWRTESFVLAKKAKIRRYLDYAVKHGTLYEYHQGTTDARHP